MAATGHDHRQHQKDIEFRDTASSAASAADELSDVQGEKMVLNMGPPTPPLTESCDYGWRWTGKSSPAEPDVGYLHRGDEKIAESMTYNQFIPYTDRLDYSRLWPTTCTTCWRSRNCSV